MTAKKIGIWMDHEQAHLTEFTTEPLKTTKLTCDFDHTVREESISKGENRMHTKEQHQQGEFYRKIGEQIRQYEDVFIFGPTDAKKELVNSLRSNHLFDSIKIKVESADKMTENQMHAFVTKHFAKH